MNGDGRPDAVLAAPMDGYGCARPGQWRSATPSQGAGIDGLKKLAQDVGHGGWGDAGASSAQTFTGQVCRDRPCGDEHLPDDRSVQCRHRCQLRFHRLRSRCSADGTLGGLKESVSRANRAATRPATGSASNGRRTATSSTRRTARCCTPARRCRQANCASTRRLHAGFGRCRKWFCRRAGGAPPVQWVQRRRRCGERPLGRP